MKDIHTDTQTDGFNEDRTGYTYDLSIFFDDMHFLEHHTSSQIDPCLVLSFEDESEAEHISESVKQIPDVLEYLQSAGKSQMYQTVTSLLTERKLPFLKIAFLLLCNVVEWFS